MKILFFGNQGGLGYWYVKWFRGSDIDADLYINSDETSSRLKLEWTDPELNNDVPHWIHKIPVNRILRLFIKVINYIINKIRIRKYIGKISVLTTINPSSKFKEISSNYDIIITSGRYIIPALKLKAPVVLIATGGDLTQLPYKCDTLVNELSSYLLRRRIKKLKLILSSLDDVKWSSKILGIENKIINFPILVDIDGFRDNINNVTFQNIYTKYSRYDWVILALSRKNMDDTKPDYKAPEKIAYALKSLKETHSIDKYKVVIGNHGKDVEEFISLLKELNVYDMCDFVDHLPVPDLHAYMSLPNAIVLDQFGIDKHNLNGAQREALSLGAHLITFRDPNHKDFIRAHGKGCPLYYAYTPDDIYNNLCEIFKKDASDIEKYRTHAINWIYNSLHWTNRINELLEILNEVYTKNYRDIS